MNLRAVLFKDSFIYGSAAYLNIISGILLTPIYTRMIAKISYGTMEIFNAWSGFLLTLIPLGLATGLVRFYAARKEDAAAKKELTGTILLIHIATILVFLTTAFLCKGPFLEAYFGVSSGVVSEVYTLMLVIIAQSVLFSFTQTILLVQRKSILYAAQSISNFLILTGLGFYFVYFRRMDIYGFYLGSAITGAISLTAGLIINWKDLSMAWSKELAGKIVRFSIPFVFTNAMIYVNDIFDRSVIIRFMTREDVGTYSIGVKIAGMTRIVYNAFNMSYYPFALSIAEKPYAKSIYALIHKIYIAVSCVVLAGGLMFRYELIQFFAPDYPEVFPIIGALLIYNVVMGGITVYSIGLHVTYKTHYIVHSIIITSIVNAVVTIILARKLGLEGVAWGSLAGGIVWLLTQMWFSQKHYPIKFSVPVLIAGIVYAILAYAGTEFLQQPMLGAWYYDTIVKGILFLLISAPFVWYVVKKTQNLTHLD